jgi:hypothetical protein
MRTRATIDVTSTALGKKNGCTLVGYSKKIALRRE